MALLAHPLVFSFWLTYDGSMLSVGKDTFNVFLLAHVEEVLWDEYPPSSGNKKKSHPYLATGVRKADN